MYEIAHILFGDMVTMKWWDDLWLNESFATIISYYACYHLYEKQLDPSELPLSEINSNSQCCINFGKETTKARIDDQKPTTHSIEAKIVSSDEAEMLIDGITYGKGAVFVR